MPDDIDVVVAALTRQFGIGSATRLSANPETDVRFWIPTGCEAIDEAIGRPGVPGGRVISIIGPPGAGKTTLVTHLIAEVQKLGDTPVYFNAEGTYDPVRATNIGVDADKVVMSYPRTVEEAFEEIKTLTETDLPSRKRICVFWDTFSASPTKAEIYGGDRAKQAANIKAGTFAETDAHQGEVAAHSRIASQQMRILRLPMEMKGVTLVVVLQSKENIDVQWGSGVTYLAEKVWWYYSDVQFEVKRVGNVMQGAEIIGIKSQIHVRKSKVGVPYKKVEVDNLFTKGFSTTSQILEQATKLGVIGIVGMGWFSYEHTPGKLPKKFTKSKWEETITEFPEILTKIEEAKKKALGGAA